MHPAAPQTPPPSPARTAPWLIAVGVAVLLVLAWSRALDHLTLAYLEDSLLGSGAIYATARSINALISVLQGTEVDVVFVSFTVGEVLDPVNDLIERFSSLLLLALGSLALQQLLITIASHPLVNGALTVLVLGAIPLWQRADPQRRRQILQFLLLLALVRLVLPVIALVGQGVDAAFLAEAERAHYDNVRAFQAELEQAGRETGIAPQVDLERQPLEEALAGVNASRLEVEAAISALEEDLAAARDALAALPQAPLWKPWEEDVPEVAEARARIAGIEAELDRRRDSADELRGEAAALGEQLECLQLRSEGRECSLAGGAVQFLRKADIRPQLAAISERVEDFSSALIKLLTSLIFRTVLLPIATLWLSVRLTQAVARRLGA